MISIALLVIGTILFIVLLKIVFPMPKKTIKEYKNRPSKILINEIKEKCPAIFYEEKKEILNYDDIEKEIKKNNKLSNIQITYYINEIKKILNRYKLIPYTFGIIIGSTIGTLGTLSLIDDEKIFNININNLLIIAIILIITGTFYLAPVIKMKHYITRLKFLRTYIENEKEEK